MDADKILHTNEGVKFDDYGDNLFFSIPYSDSPYRLISYVKFYPLITKKYLRADKFFYKSIFISPFKLDKIITKPEDEWIKELDLVPIEISDNVTHFFQNDPLKRKVKYVIWKQNGEMYEDLPKIEVYEYEDKNNYFLVEQRWELHDYIIDRKYWSDGDLHRLNGPALIRYINGEKIYEKWSQNGEPYRLDGPAQIFYDFDGGGNKIKELWSPNRESEPSIIKYYDNGVISSQKWLKEDLMSRIDGPAYISYNKNGIKIHEEWRIIDPEERDIINGRSYKTHKRSLLHRDNGAAIIHYNDNGQITSRYWFHMGKRLTEEEFKKFLVGDLWIGEDENFFQYLPVEMINITKELFSDTPNQIDDNREIRIRDNRETWINFEELTRDEGENEWESKYLYMNQKNF